MKRMKFFGFGIIYLLVMIPMVFAGGGQSQGAAGSSASSTATYVGPNRSHNGYPLPITEKPIEIEAIINSNPIIPDIHHGNVVKWLAEQTNIKLNISQISTEQINLIFASRDFPDIMLRTNIGTSPYITAARDGDIIKLDDLLQKYSPSWWKFFNENQLIKNQCSVDGSISYLPLIWWEEYTRNIRDLPWINKTWLDELGLKVPATTEEFKNVLLAFKNNAGKGSIPKEVRPWLFGLPTEQNGTWYEMMAYFGVFLPSGQNWNVADNGTIVNNTINPDIVLPLKYMQDLYRSGLIPPESLDNLDINEYIRMTSSNPPLAGFYMGNSNLNANHFIPIAPFKSPSGKTPFIRTQAWVANMNQEFVIFEKCKDPVALVKLMEYLAVDIEARATVIYGMKDVVWEFTPDGKVNRLFWTNDPRWQQNSMSTGFTDTFPNLMLPDYFNNHYFNANLTRVNTVEWAYENIWKHTQPPANLKVPVYGSITDTNRVTRMNAIGSDIAALRLQTITRWISTNANIDAEWNGFVTQVKALGYDEYLKYLQELYDLVNK